MRHAQTHNIQLSGPTVHSLYCATALGIHIIREQINRKFSFHYSGPHLWNSLPSCLTNSKSIFQFKAKYKHYLINTKRTTD